MPNDKQNTSKPSDNNAEVKKRMEALALAIHEEMGSLTQEEIERLYVEVMLMAIRGKQNK